MMLLCISYMFGPAADMVQIKEIKTDLSYEEWLLAFINMENPIGKALVVSLTLQPLFFRYHISSGISRSCEHGNQFGSDNQGTMADAHGVR
jgi:hypothetical protein